jgi:hypothetical protein
VGRSVSSRGCKVACSHQGCDQRLQPFLLASRWHSTWVITLPCWLPGGGWGLPLGGRCSVGYVSESLQRK